MESWMLIAALALPGALLAYALARACRKVVQDVETAPLLTLLRSARQEPDPVAAGHALRRCSFCSAAEICRQRIAAKAPIPEYCPNADFLARIC